MFSLDINTKNRATTQYTNWPFNSMVRFGGKYLGASNSGLFEIGGSSDNQKPIAAYFEPVRTDFGISNPKRLRFMYFGFESDGDLEVEITVDEQVVRTYTITARKTGQQRVRLVIGRDGQGRYWSFRVKNTSGCDFSIDSVQVLPIVRTQGIH